MLRAALVTLLLPSVLWGAEFPLCRAGQDLSITGGKSAREFFAARAAQTECRAALETAKRAFQENPSQATRDALLAKVEECGDCVTKQVERKTTQGAGGQKTWYVADGACYVAGANAAETRRGYEKARDSLKVVAGYSKRTGGFDALLEFLPVHPTSGEWQRNVERLETFPFHAFVALRGPRILGIAYTQLFKITWDEKAESTSVVFDGIPTPRSFKMPTIYDGTKQVTPVRLSKVYARWYLDAEGYVRYCSAGDFGLPLPGFALEAGRDMERDTIYTMSERLL